MNDISKEKDVEFLRLAVKLAQAADNAVEEPGSTQPHG